MADFILKGMGVALLTPFRQDNTIDFNALGNIVDYVIGGGCDFIVVLGTTAETPTLSAEEQDKVRHFVKDRTAGRVPLVLGIGGNNTAALTERLSNDELEGYSAILSVVPYYNKPSQEGIYRHYKAIAEASPVPVVLYNVPGRTGVNMTAETVLRLASECPEIIGVKEASGRSDQIQALLARKPDGFEVISGDDALTYPIMGIGASGVISVIGNAYPAAFSRMVHLCQEGNRDEAAKIHSRLAELYKLLFADGNPSGVKAVMHALGMIDNVVRLPLVPVTPVTEQRIKEIVNELKGDPDID